MRAPLAILPILAVVAGCPAPPWEDDGEPSIVMVFPETSTSEVYCPSLTVVVEVDHFELDASHIGEAPVEGEGHWQLLDVHAGGVRLVGESGTSFLSIPESNALAEGYHELIAELVGHDRQPLEPPVAYRVHTEVVDVPGCLGSEFDP